MSGKKQIRLQGCVTCLFVVVSTIFVMKHLEVLLSDRDIQQAIDSSVSHLCLR
jgi:hypothetical protein